MRRRKMRCLAKKNHESVKKMAELTIVTMHFAWPSLDQAEQCCISRHEKTRGHTVSDLGNLSGLWRFSAYSCQ